MVDGGGRRRRSGRRGRGGETVPWRRRVPERGVARGRPLRRRRR